MAAFGEGLGKIGKGVGDGVSNIGEGVGKGVGSIGKGVGDSMSDPRNAPGNVTKGVGEGVGNIGGGVGKGVGDVGSGAVGGVGDTATGVKDTGKQAGNAARDVGDKTGGSSIVGSMTSGIGAGFSEGFKLAGNLSKDAFDLQKNVVSGATGIAGTAIDGVVSAASTTTGAVFNPIANGLKAIEGLEGLGEGLESINGLSTQALQGVASATKQALQVAGKPPTFFDPDADGVVKFDDTQRGFVALGLEETYAKIAAYALHSTFSYTTADSWLSFPGSQMPINIDKMPQTRWGKNWGNFERMDWVSDADVETFFGVRERATWGEYFKDIKSYFGVALLIFEWGTTWPFILPKLDAASPFTEQMGTVMRTVILPTIAKSHENAKKASGEGKSEMPDPTPMSKAPEKD